jgi:hypothetical protein
MYAPSFQFGEKVYSMFRVIILRNVRVPCIAILTKQKCLFSKMENRKVKQVLSGGWYQWEGGKYKERI